MTEYVTADQQRLQAALDQPVGADLLDQLSRMSLLTMAADVPEYAPVLDEYSKPDRAELDLHLDGVDVEHPHETDARRFGTFVARAADSVKEVAKSQLGKARLSTRLQVVGAEPGSVRVVLRAPEVPPRSADGTPTPMRVDPPEAAAIRLVARVLVQAERSDEVLVASVRELSKPAQQSLHQMANAIVDGGWRIVGAVRQKGLDTIPITVTTTGAHRLVDATEARDLDERTTMIHGVADGWVWGEQVFTLIPDGRKRMRIAVNTPDLQARVAELVGEHKRVIATVHTVETRFQGAAGVVEESHVMTDVVPEPPPAAEEPSMVDKQGGVDPGATAAAQDPPAA